MLGCVAFIVSGVCWLIILSAKSEPKVDVRLENKRMSLLNGTGVDPAGQMFKGTDQREPDQNSQEESALPFTASSQMRPTP